jgi:hypothetical protein
LPSLLSFYLSLKNVLPHLFFVIGDWPHQGFNKILSRLHAQNGQNTSFGLYPKGLFLGLWI